MKEEPKCNHDYGLIRIGEGEYAIALNDQDFISGVDIKFKFCPKCGINFKKKEDKLQRQKVIAEEIAELADTTVCTCGSCGAVNLIIKDVDEIECYDCGFKGEPCDFPDLFY